MRQVFGVLIFAIGVLASALLTGGLAWAGLEATLYHFHRYTDESFDGLSCPLLMTHQETGTVRVAVYNPSGSVIAPNMTIHLSDSWIPTSDEVSVEVEPGEIRELEWDISSENVDRDYFIFAKVYSAPSNSMPAAEATCGILALNVPFLTGIQLLSLWLALGLVFPPLGLWVWRLSLVQPRKMPWIATALVVTSFGGLVASLSGVWMLGIVFLIAVVLMVQALPRR